MIVLRKSKDPAPATPTSEIPTLIDYTMTIVGAAIAIMVVVIVVGILLYRKK